MALPQFTARVAVCHADGWLQQLHARAVDRLNSADHRHQLLHCLLQMTDVAGWPSLELVDPLAEPSPDLLKAYCAALAAVLQQAAEALVAGPRPDPEPDDEGLSGLWRQVLSRMHGTSASMAFWRARLISLDAERALIEFPSDGWVRHAHQFLPDAEGAMALVLGQRIAVVPTWPDADGGEG